MIGCCGGPHCYQASRLYKGLGLFPEIAYKVAALPSSRAAGLRTGRPKASSTRPRYPALGTQTDGNAFFQKPGQISPAIGWISEEASSAQPP